MEGARLQTAAIELAALKCVVEQFGDIAHFARTMQPEHAVACATQKSLRTRCIGVLKPFGRASWAK